MHDVSLSSKWIVGCHNVKVVGAWVCVHVEILNFSINFHPHNQNMRIKIQNLKGTGAVGLYVRSVAFFPTVVRSSAPTPCRKSPGYNQGLYCHMARGTT
jgi:hypothetical protein